MSTHFSKSPGLSQIWYLEPQIWSNFPYFSSAIPGVCGHPPHVWPTRRYKVMTASSLLTHFGTSCDFPIVHGENKYDRTWNQEIEWEMILGFLPEMPLWFSEFVSAYEMIQWLGVKIGYSNHQMANTKNGLQSVVQVFHFLTQSQMRPEPVVDGAGKRCGPSQ